ncbi:transketolase [Boseongicola aestuarii]|uniref:Transketolase n=1 Tax=Boseongicola aestuarii TaxID=1470561 RepID=A0A238IXZ3_9RHOB|nr:transketolase [Boseongicola aestuarii]SMX23359.1 Transketolase 2 [Boseongicola aestuarii]
MTRHQEVHQTDASELANALRFLAADSVEKAKSGHPGMPLGMADLATVLFTKHLKFDVKNPEWPDRDRFILSNGHGSMLQYSLLHLLGYEGATIKELQRFRQLHARTAGHPELGYLPGIETTTGPLGQGLGNSVGFALGERMMNADFGDDLVDHRTWVFCGDGCLMEGVGQEAISLAGHLKLSKLTLVFDDNRTTIDGATSVATSENHAARFAAANWRVLHADGHDHDDINEAMTEAKTSDQPTVIIARTRIGFGAPTKEGKSIVHGSPLGPDELAGLRKNLNWPHEPFVIPEPIKNKWRSAGVAGATERLAWQDRLKGISPATREKFERRISGKFPPTLEAEVKAAIKSAVATPTAAPIRKGSLAATAVLQNSMPELVGGSADLTGSVLTKPDNMQLVVPGEYAGRHVGYGIREHVMAATMNGLALHGGFFPYGGTYLTFSDYCRPSIRMAAIMNIRVVFLFSHDSIGVGEDGPTHQPIEQLASLRAIPNLRVYRPADGVEALECWLDAALHSGPSAMVVARQAVEPVRRVERPDMPSRRGGYVLQEAREKRDLTLIATGSEVDLAIRTAALLEKSNINAAIVSLPCWETFDVQDQSYRDAVLGTGPRYAIEAALPMGWGRYVGSEENVFGVPSFGMSGPGPQVYAEMGLIPETIAESILNRLGAKQSVTA